MEHINFEQLSKENGKRRKIEAKRNQYIFYIFRIFIAQSCNSHSVVLFCPVSEHFSKYNLLKVAMALRKVPSVNFRTNSSRLQPMQVTASQLRKIDSTWGFTWMYLVSPEHI